MSARKKEIHLNKLVLASLLTAAAMFAQTTAPSKPAQGSSQTQSDAKTTKTKKVKKAKKTAPVSATSTGASATPVKK